MKSSIMEYYLAPKWVTIVEVFLSFFYLNNILLLGYSKETAPRLSGLADQQGRERGWLFVSSSCV